MNRYIVVVSRRSFYPSPSPNKHLLPIVHVLSLIRSTEIKDLPCDYKNKQEGVQVKKSLYWTNFPDSPP